MAPESEGELEVALAAFTDGPPRRVTLIGRSDDGRGPSHWKPTRAPRTAEMTATVPADSCPSNVTSPETATKGGMRAP